MTTRRQASVVATFIGGPCAGKALEIECPGGSPPHVYYVTAGPPPLGVELAPTDPATIVDLKRGAYRWTGGQRGVDALDVPWRIARYEWKGWEGEDRGVDLPTWLLEQIAEDESLARSATDDGAASWRRAEFPAECAIVDDHGEIVVYDEGRPSAEQCDHIVAWCPVRVLAECAAKRHAIARYMHVREHLPGSAATSALADTLRELTLPYADRDGYREEWRPTW